MDIHLIFILNSLSILAGSFAYIICSQPFFKDKSYTNVIIQHYFNSNLVYLVVSPYLVQNTSEYHIVSWVVYPLSFELIYYIWHRILHLKLLYKYFHAHHHVNYIVYPMDFLDLDYIDNLGLVVGINLPVFWTPLNPHEYFMWYFAILFSGFLLHSNRFNDHHVLHHRHFHCNYSFLLPVFDILFGTEHHHPQMRS